MYTEAAENLPGEERVRSKRMLSSFQRRIQLALLKLMNPKEPLYPMTPLGLELPNLNTLRIHRETHIMSILNVTPDSFSDGGLNHNIDKATLANTIRSHIADGATIIDVGGQSTRPGSTQVSTEEELARVLPVLEVIESIPEADDICVSVDTYRARVAEEAIAAGADMINDISAGMMDEDMLPTIARLGCTICLMHMRGTPDTMMDFTDYPSGVLSTVGDELLARVSAAENAGIRRWRIILDPGIGFSKTHDQNLLLLMGFRTLKRYPGLSCLPWLVGTSRKSFIGNITGVKEAKERTWGTAAAVSFAVQSGVDIVRVHDVKEMKQVAKMTDAIRMVSEHTEADRCVRWRKEHIFYHQ
jgi:2-amino-4-hydroxy-6-hydroxymethyldihydropteridine diphosphokinase/dihydropteroate synthase